MCGIASCRRGWGGGCSGWGVLIVYYLLSALASGGGVWFWGSVIKFTMDHNGAVTRGPLLGAKGCCEILDTLIEVGMVCPSEVGALCVWEVVYLFWL